MIVPLDYHARDGGGDPECATMMTLHEACVVVSRFVRIGALGMAVVMARAFLALDH